MAEESWAAGLSTGAALRNRSTGNIWEDEMRPAGRRLPACGLEDILCRFPNSRHQFYLTNTHDKQVLGASVGWGLCEYPPSVILLS